MSALQIILEAVRTVVEWHLPYVVMLVTGGIIVVPAYGEDT